MTEAKAVQSGKYIGRVLKEKGKNKTIRLL